MLFSISWELMFPYLCFVTQHERFRALVLRVCLTLVCVGLVIHDKWDIVPQAKTCILCVVASALVTGLVVIEWGPGTLLRIAKSGLLVADVMTTFLDI